MALLSLLLPTAVLYPQPHLEITESVFDFGTIPEGKHEKVSHAFVLKNTGYDTLLIQKVKPG